MTLMDERILTVVVWLALAILTGLSIYFLRRRFRGSEKTRDRLTGSAVAWLREHGLESHYVDVDGEAVHYTQGGKGPHLVFLHGIGASLFTWRFLLPRFMDRYTVTAIDIPGFGRSHKRPRADYGLDAQRRRLNRVLDELGIKECFLVGSSMGATIALWMAHENPERFPRIAVLAPATNPKVVPIRMSKLASYAPRGHRVINQLTVRWIYGRVVSRAELVEPETVDAYLEPFLDDGLSVQSFLAAVLLLADQRMPTCFAGIKSALLIIGGGRDRLVSMRSLHRLRALVPQAKLVVHPTAGHHMMEDEPEWTAMQLTAHFSEQPDPTPVA